MESVWASIRTDWQDEALCKGANGVDFVPDVETDAGLERVRQSHCNHCPVKDKCLNWALVNGDRGYWGGTSTVHRNALKRVRTRAKCPVCRSQNLLWTGEYEVCTGCGASWQGDTRSARKPGKPVAVRNPSVTPVEDVPIPEGESACL